MTADPSETVRTTLLHAIRVEARNGAIYDTLAKLFEGYDAGLTSLFDEMAVEEREHGANLQERYRERFGAVPATGGEPAAVIEAPDLDDAEAFIFDSMTVERALQMGLRAEKEAREFYACEVARTADPALQKLYRELSEFEQTHVDLLRVRLAGLRRAAHSGRR